jgi:HK97 family phage major capsid protein
MNLKQLRDAFAAKSAELSALLEKGNDITGEDFQKIQALNAEIEGFQSQIKSAQEQEKALAELRKKQGERVKEIAEVKMPVPHATSAGGASFTKDSDATVEIKDNVLKLAMDGKAGISKKQWEAISTQDYLECYAEYLKHGLHGIGGVQLKTLQEGADQAGGFLVPEAILSRLIQKQPTPTRIAGMVSRLTTGRDHLSIPRVVYNTDNLYTTGIRVTWTGEVPASSTTHRVTDPVFGQLRIPVYTGMLSCPVTNDVIEDSMFGLVDWISGKFRETIDLLQDNMVLNGTGLGQPLGLLANVDATSDDPASYALGNPITADGIMGLSWAIPEQYDENLTWCFNKTNVGSYVATLVDDQKRYLWGMGYQDSGLNVPQRRTLAGYPVAFSGFSPDRATNAYPMTLGDWSGYYLLERVGLSLQVLNEVYAELNQKVLLGRIRFGGMCAEPWKFKIGKQA